MNLRSEHGGWIGGTLRTACALTFVAAGIVSCRDVLSWRQLVAGSGGNAGAGGSGTGGTGAATGGAAGTTITCTTTPSLEDCSTPEDEACNGNSPDDCGQYWAHNDSGEGGMGERHIQAMTVDADGNPIIAGWFKGSLKLKSAKSGACDRDSEFTSGFVAKLDKETLECLDIWTLPMNGPENTIKPTGLAVNPNDEIFITGTLTGPIAVSDGCPSSEGSGKGIFLAKLSQSTPYCISFGTSSDDVSTGILLQDADVIVVGSAGGSLMPNGCMLMASGTTDAFAARFSAQNGMCQFIKSFGGPDSQRITGIASSSTSDLFVIGDSGGNLDSDGDCAQETHDGENGVRDMFLARLGGADGACKWRASYGGPYHQIGAGIAKGATDIFVTGEFVQEFADLVHDVSPLKDMIVLSPPLDDSNASGKARWFQVPVLHPNASFADASLITVGDDGVGDSIFVAGSFFGSVELSGNLLESAGKEDILLERLTPDGVHVWSKRFGDGERQQAKALALSLDGGLFLAGDYTGVINFGNPDHRIETRNGANDIFVVKLSR